MVDGRVLLAAAVLVPLLRQRGTPSWETVWSEDASIYTYQAVWHGSLDSLFRGYAGYLQLPPRLMAVPTPYFSLRYLSVYDALISTVTGALLAWSTYILSRAGCARGSCNSPWPHWWSSCPRSASRAPPP